MAHPATLMNSMSRPLQERQFEFDDEDDKDDDRRVVHNDEDEKVG